MHRKVLLVEDDDQMRDIVGELLADEGIDVVAVATGAEALRTFGEQPAGFGGVILDLTLPDVPGEQVFEQLRRADPNIPIILTSGLTAAEASSRFEGLDSAAFVPKPFRGDTLLALVRPWLE